MQDVQVCVAVLLKGVLLIRNRKDQLAVGNPGAQKEQAVNEERVVLEEVAARDGDLQVILHGRMRAGRVEQIGVSIHFNKTLHLWLVLSNSGRTRENWTGKAGLPRAVQQICDAPNALKLRARGAVLLFDGREQLRQKGVVAGAEKAQEHQKRGRAAAGTAAFQVGIGAGADFEQGGHLLLRDALCVADPDQRAAKPAFQRALELFPHGKCLPSTEFTKILQNK